MSEEFIYNFQYNALILFATLFLLKFVLFLTTLRSRYFSVNNFIYFPASLIRHSGSHTSKNMKKVQNVLSYTLLTVGVLYIVERFIVLTKDL